MTRIIAALSITRNITGIIGFLAFFATFLYVILGFVSKFGSVIPSVLLTVAFFTLVASFATFLKVEALTTR